MRVALILLFAMGVSAAATAKPARKGPAIGDERILLHTSRGDIVVGLYDEVAPRHAAQLRKLVRLGVYDTASFFRIEPGYLVQITDAPNRKQPLSDEQRKAIAPIPAEFSKLKHRPGVVSMAREDRDVNSARTSFSFMLGKAPDLDGQYTIVGEVEWGQPLLTQLAREPREWNNRPRTPVIVDRAEIKTGAEIAALREAAGLRNPTPLPPPGKP